MAVPGARDTVMAKEARFLATGPYLPYGCLSVRMAPGSRWQVLGGGAKLGRATGRGGLSGSRMEDATWRRRSAPCHLSNSEKCCVSNTQGSQEGVF